MIYGGHFRTCRPLGLFEKPGASSLQMVRHFFQEDQFGDSTNGWVDDSNDFPTRWFIVAQMTDFVCSCQCFILCPHPTLPDSEHFICAIDLSSVLNVTTPPGIPWHPIENKGQDFAFSPKNVVFVWDLMSRRSLGH